MHAFLTMLTGEELQEDPTDRLANLILNSASAITMNDLNYGGIFLVSHGIVNSLLVFFLFRGIRKIYPYAIFVLILFTIYQSMHFVYSKSLVDLLFIAIDFLVVALTYLEYRHFSKKRPSY